MELKLNAQSREKNEKLSKENLAAILYGKGIKSQSLKLNRPEFIKLFSSAGESNLIDLDFSGKKTKVLIKEVQTDPVKDWIRHVDLYQVNMKEKINAEIPLHFIGESTAVKEQGGILIKEVHEVKVECLPGDLVDHIDVDVSLLQEIDDIIKVSDLKMPTDMEVLLSPDSVIAMAAEPKVQEEEPIVTEDEEEQKVEGEEIKEGQEEETKEGEVEAKEKEKTEEK